MIFKTCRWPGPPIVATPGYRPQRLKFAPVLPPTPPPMPHARFLLNPRFLICPKFWVGSILLLFAPAANAAPPPIAESYDVVVYGGTAAGVVAAVEVARHGKTVVIVGPDTHLGGLTSGGLGWTDSGRKETVGGLSREFYRQVYEHYQNDDAWRQQTREQYGTRSQGTPEAGGDRRSMWVFEPHVAEAIFDRWVTQNDIPVYRNLWLDRDGGVETSNGHIASITMLTGETFAGRMFIDATYEGDLMAAAGIDYHVGREPVDQYDESYNGVQTGVYHHSHHFNDLPPISAYRTAGDPNSGVLPLISTEPPGEKFSGDDRVQAYCFRMCLTDAADNRVPFPRPDGYDADRYELLARVFDAGWGGTFNKFDPLPNRKTDTNNHGPVSTDHIGANYDYPEADYDRRREIIAEHEAYQKSLMYFLANDARVPEAIQAQVRRWGLAADEFVDNGNWPHQLYIREARRMIGQYVLTQNNLQGSRPTPDSVGMGSYAMDSHNIQRYVDADGHVQNEGDIGVGVPPYEIPYGSIVPRDGQCGNLLVPVCVSTSHIAFGSVRMEPVFMILGHSAAAAAMMAIVNDCDVQDVDVAALQEHLTDEGQVLHYEAPPQKRPGQTLSPASSFGGIVVDDARATTTGAWGSGRSGGPAVDNGYRYADPKAATTATAEFIAELPAPGRYEIRIAYNPHPNRASNAKVAIGLTDQVLTKQINQRVPPPIDKLWISMGTYDFTSDKSVVEVTTDGADGFVTIDAVHWLVVSHSGKMPAAHRCSP